MEIQLWKKIPVDIFINHIMPYAYKKHDTNLLNDIRNFIFDYRMIINYYFTDLNEYCLLADIIWFCNNQPVYNNISNSFIYILERNIMFRKLPLDKKYEFVKQIFYYNVIVKTEMKIKFIFSLLTPSERACFINQYIIEYYE
jgi:hypothetical protein